MPEAGLCFSCKYIGFEYDQCFMNNAVLVNYCFQYISFEVSLKISEI